ncbi:hypothetical protein V5O48_000719 [Marasmius crinis-equi]|uniref:C2H2-type domain-containing protein n=1 Tax=Marasmius crinis-equi TaxID=585013 RepID=A0ABR3G0I1_9AGAR
MSLRTFDEAFLTAEWREPDPTRSGFLKNWRCTTYAKVPSAAKTLGMDGASDSKTPFDTASLSCKSALQLLNNPAAWQIRPPRKTNSGTPPQPGQPPELLTELPIEELLDTSAWETEDVIHEVFNNASWPSLCTRPCPVLSCGQFFFDLHALRLHIHVHYDTKDCTTQLTPLPSPSGKHCLPDLDSHKWKQNERSRPRQPDQIERSHDWHKPPQHLEHSRKPEYRDLHGDETSRPRVERHKVSLSHRVPLPSWDLNPSPDSPFDIPKLHGLEAYESASPTQKSPYLDTSILKLLGDLDFANDISPFLPSVPLSDDATKVDPSPPPSSLGTTLASLNSFPSFSSVMDQPEQETNGIASAFSESDCLYEPHPEGSLLNCTGQGIEAPDDVVATSPHLTTAPVQEQPFIAEEDERSREVDVEMADARVVRDLTPPLVSDSANPPAPPLPKKRGRPPKAKAEPEGLSLADATSTSGSPPILADPSPTLKSMVQEIFPRETHSRRARQTVSYAEPADGEDDEDDDGKPRAKRRKGSDEYNDRPSKRRKGNAYRCTVPGCKTTTTRFADLLRHVNSKKHNNILFGCPLCSDWLQRHDAVIRHLKTCHDTILAEDDRNFRTKEG